MLRLRSHPGRGTSFHSRSSVVYGKLLKVVRLCRLPPATHAHAHAHARFSYARDYRVCVGVCVCVGVKLGHRTVWKPLDATSSWIPRTARTLRTPENTVMVQQSLSTHAIICTQIHLQLLMSLPSLRSSPSPSKQPELGCTERFSHRPSIS